MVEGNKRPENLGSLFLINVYSRKKVHLFRLILIPESNPKIYEISLRECSFFHEETLRKNGSVMNEM